MEKITWFLDSKELCCKKIKQENNGFVYNIKKCGKKATHTNGSHSFCRQHSKMGRFVIRDGDIGAILFRCDTEQELRKNIINYPEMRMQKITPSHRKDIY